MGFEFNESQKKALKSSKSLIISAGAGSGKTAVLTEKVYQIINEDNGIEPENLLVLTFTDKAAYQMQTKIIKKFEDNHSPYAQTISSAHIQTFDSFSSFLVKKYAEYLNINPNFNIIDDSISKAKENEILDEILKSLYIKKDPTIKRMLNKYCFKGDSNLKTFVLKLKEEIDRFDPESRDKFFNHYEENFLNETHIKERLLNYVNEYYINPLNDYITEAKYKIQDPNNALLKSFDNLLTKKDEEYLDSFSITFDSRMGIRSSTNITPDFSKLCLEFKKVLNDKTLFENIKDSFNKLFSYLSNYRNIEYQVNKILSAKDDIIYLLSLVKEVETKLNDYKFLTSSYTYSDVQRLSLKLLKEEKYKEIKEEIRNNFKFILVDEYQDNNDIQESFINALAQNSDNKLFLVGDIKQSIYRFRYANPKLFLARKEKFSSSSEFDAIDMNTNYRSLEIILKLVNKYFEKNMTLENGGLIFNDSEKLVYDKSKDIYKGKSKNNDNERGFNFLLSNTVLKEASNEIENEIYLILNDIISKINNKYQVVDFDDNNNLILRDCEFKDFAILTKRKNNYSLYKEIFEKYEVPLNIAYDDNIRTIDSIIVIESIFKLYYSLKIDKSKNEIKEKSKIYDDIRHYFVSLARSYLYSYSDQKIYELIKENNYYNNEIIKKMNNFIKQNSFLSLSETVLKLIDEYEVIKKIPHIGNSFNHLSLIEYIYSLTKQLENNGSHLDGFISLLDSLNKYKISLNQETLFSSDNSVELTTIFKSKGLEYKIVYLPLGECKYSNNNHDKTPFYINKDEGIFLPNYELNLPLHTSFKEILTSEEKKENRNEYERLLYVALTREKESLYFVNPIFKIKDKVDSYKEIDSSSTIMEEIFNAFPFKINLNESYLNFLKENEIIEENNIEALKEYVSFINYFSLHQAKEKINEVHKYKNYIKLNYKRLIQDLLNKVGEVKNNKDKIFDKNLESNLDELVLCSSKEDEDNSLTLNIKNISNISKALNYLILRKFINTNFDLNKHIKKDDNKLYLEMLTLKNRLNEIKDKITKEVEPDLLIDRVFLRIILLFSNKDKNNDKLFLKEGLFNIDFIDFKMKYFDHDQNINTLKDVENINNALPSLKEKNEDLYIFNKIKKRRASKELSNEDKYNEELINSLEYGTHLHFLLELLDFKNPDYSYLKTQDDLNKIKKVRELKIFDDIKDALKIYKEYQYEKDGVEGSIDLLIVYKDKILIIDYKTSNINKDEYTYQLNEYRKVIEERFKTFENSKNIKMYLLSIVKGECKEVQYINY